MTQWLKQSTAVTVKMGPFVDETDGKTAETGLTIAQADIRLTKNGGAYAQTNNAAGATHDEGGEYGVPLDTTDTGTLGRLKVRIHESGALPVWQEFIVVPANVYDSFILGSDTLDVQVTGIGANVINAAAIAADAITDAKVASDVTIASVTGAVGSVTGAVGSVTGNVGGNVTGSVGSVATGGIAAASFAAGAIDAAAIANGAIDAATFAAGAIDAAAIANGAIDAATFAAGAINAAAIAADAITDAKVASDVTIASVTGAVGSVTGNVGGNVTGSVGSVATGGIAAASFAAGAIDAAAIANGAIDAATFAAGAIDAAAIAADAIDASALAADAVAEIQSGLSTLTAAGVRTAVGLASANLDTQLSPLALLQAMIEAGVGSPTYYRFTATALELAPTGGSAPSAAVIADAVWDEARAGHVAGGTFGEGVASVQGNITGSVASVATGGIAAATFAANALDAVWSTAARVLTAGTNIVLAKGTGVTGFNDLDAAGIRSAVGLSVANLDTQLTPLGLLQSMIEVGTGSPTYYRYTATALELAPTGGSAPSAAVIADAVWDEGRAGHVGAGSFGEGVASVQGNVTGSAASVTADVGITQTGADKVWSTTTRLLTAGTNIVLAKGTGVTGFNDLSAAQVNTEADTAIADAGLATASAVTTVGSNVSAIKTVTDLLQTMIEAGPGSPTYYRYKVTAVELAPAGGSGLDAAGVRAAIGMASADLDTQLAALPTASENADAVWDEAIAGHLGAGSTGLALSNAGAAGNPWSTVIEGAYTAEDILRFLAAVAVGKTTIVSVGSTATVTFRDITDASNIVVGTAVGSERTSLTLSP